MPRPFRGSAGPPAPLKFDFGSLDVPGQKVLERYDAEGRQVLLGLGGIRGGKSWYGARWGLRKAFKRGGTGWIVVPDYRKGTEITRLLNAVLRQHWEMVGNFHEHPFPQWDLKSVGKHGPAQIEIQSAYDPEDLTTATLSWAWIDEGAYIPERGFQNVQGRVLSTAGPVLVTTTPLGKNWVYERLYKPFAAGDPRYGFAVLRTQDNPHLPQDEVRGIYDQYGRESAYARQQLDAEFVSFEGLVYPAFGTNRHLVDTPPQTFRGVWAGADWGFFPDPAACVVLGQDTLGTWWVLHEIYKHRLTVPEFAQLLDAVVRQYSVKTVYADPFRPDTIAQMQRAGLPVVAATKVKDSNVAIQKIARLLETDRLKVMRHCTNTIREFGLYRYPEKGRRDKPVGVDDHTMDCIRYCLWMREPEQTLVGDRPKISIAQPVWAMRH